MAKKKETTEEKVVKKATKVKEVKKIISKTIEVWDPTRGKMKSVSNPLYK